MVLKEFIPTFVLSVQSAILPGKCILLLKGDTNQGNVLCLFAKRNKILWVLIWFGAFFFLGLNLWLELLNSIFQIKSSETVVKVSLICIVSIPTTCLGWSLIAEVPSNNDGQTNPYKTQLGNTWWLRLVIERTCCLIYLKRQQILGWWLKAREGVCDMQIILHFW